MDVTDVRYNENTYKKRVMYRYTVDLKYLNLSDGVSTDIIVENIKSIVIDHDIDNNCMPMVFIVLSLDKSLLDHIIKNADDNLFIFSLYKYDDVADFRNDVLCFSKKFTYFIQDDLNKNDQIDYMEESAELNHETIYRTVTIGLLCIDHINDNKKSIEINAKNSSMFDIVKYVTGGFKNLIIEPFYNNKKYPQFILPVQDSVNKTLKALNGQSVFYSTPYRFYQDFNTTYLISSSGKAIKKKDEDYSSVVINILQPMDREANDEGCIINNKDKTFEVPINYVNTQSYDNSMVNKSRSSIKGISSNGSSTNKLKNTASYSKEKTVSVRLNNDNTGMLDNLTAESNNNNFFLYFQKPDLDIDLFSINKSISVHNVDSYQSFNGNYLVYRKREYFARVDNSFILTSMINLRRIG